MAVATSSLKTNCNEYRHAERGAIPVDHGMVKEALRQSWCLIVRNVEPRDIVDLLFQEEIITADEREKTTIQTETREPRCRTLGDILMRRICDSAKLGVLLHAMNDAHYGFIVTEILSRVYPTLSAVSSHPSICMNYEQIPEESGSHNRGENGAIIGASRDVALIPEILSTSGSASLSSDVSHTCRCQIVCGNNDQLCMDHDFEQDNSMASIDFIEPTGVRSHGKSSFSDTFHTASAAKDLVIALTFCDKKTGFTSRRGFSLKQCSPLVLSPSNHGRAFVSKLHQSVFNSLSVLVNSDDLDNFRQQSALLRTQHYADADVMGIILYLEASACIFKSDYRGCKHLVKQGLELMPFSRVPNQLTVQLLSLAIWRMIKCGHGLGKLKSSIDSAMQLICQDPVSCSGMAAGWIYVDEAKYLMKFLMSSTNSTSRQKQILREAAHAYRTAIEHFRNDSSKDGPYGFNYAAIKLASVLLACDDNLKLVDKSALCLETGIIESAQLLSSVDNSEVGVTEVLKPLFYSSQADFKFRTGCFRRACDLANDGRRCAENLGMTEELAIAEVRCRVYSEQLRKTPLSPFQTLLNYQRADSRDGGSELSDDELPEPCLKRKVTSRSNTSQHIFSSKFYCKLLKFTSIVFVILFGVVFISLVISMYT